MRSRIILICIIISLSLCCFAVEAKIPGGSSGIRSFQPHKMKSGELQPFALSYDQVFSDALDYDQVFSDALSYDEILSDPLDYDDIYGYRIIRYFCSTWNHFLSHIFY